MIRWTNAIIIALFYIAGLIFSQIIKIPLLITSILLISSVLFYLKYKNSRVIIIFLAFITGLYITDFSSRIKKTENISKFIGKERVINIKIISPVKKRKNYNSFYAEVYKIDNYSVKAKLNIITKLSSSLFSEGERYLIKATIRKPSGPENFGEIDYGFIYKKLNISGIVYLDSVEQILSKIKPKKYSIKYFASYVKNSIRRYIYEYQYPVQINFLKAILLGDRSDFPKVLKDIFVNTGTIHILAISGLHIGIIMYLVFSFFKNFGIVKRYNLLVTFFIIVFYNFIIGYRDPIVRATIMFGSIIICYIFDRDRDYLNSLAIAAILILLFDPYALKRVSFQLSFLSLAGIILFSNEIEKLFVNFKFYKIKIFNYIIKLISASISSQIFLFPVLIFHFNKFAYIAVIANIFAIPFLTIILTFTLIGYFIYLIYPPVSYFIIDLNNFLIALMIYILKFFSKIKVLYLSSLSPLFIIVYFLIVFLIFYKRFIKSALLEKYLFKKFKLQYALLIFSIFILAFYSKISISKKFSESKFDITNEEIIVFNIRGNSIFIKTKNNKVILIDCGRKEDARNIIIPFLIRNNVRKIDYLILTSTLKDYSEGVIPILNHFEVANFFDTGFPSEEFHYYRIIELITEKNIKYTQLFEGKEFKIDDLNFLVLNPPEGFFPKIDSDKVSSMEHTGNNSMVLKILWNNRAILILSDIKLRAVKYIERNYREKLKSDIVILPVINYNDYFYSRILNYAQPVLMIYNKRAGYFGRSSKEFIKEFLSNYKVKLVFTKDKGAIKIFQRDGEFKYITSK